jgi:4-amino-4-deoxy-L-arabinose transferase-like glycosyltransferase
VITRVLRSLTSPGPALLGLVVIAALTRLYQFQGPLLDRLYVKQIYEANHARNIAAPPLDPLRSTLDFLDDHGQKMELQEEVPLYNALVGASYHLFGEREWLGRVWSLAAMLIAILGLYDLVKSEYDSQTGLVAAFLLAMTPLSIFYGRAVLPDPCMMACMVVCAAAFRRYLDRGEQTRWLVVAAAAGLLGAVFKYYGIFILFPLADMAYRRGGWRYWLNGRFLSLVAAIVIPIALWLIGVFARSANPTSRTRYLVWQEPSALLNSHLYDRLTWGLFVKDCGLVTALLIALGALAALRGKERSRPLWGWSLMGLCFWFLFAPKMLEHDYYELVFLPVLAAWGALGWRSLERLTRHRPSVRLWAGGAVLGLAAIIHSPLVVSAKYELEIGHLVVAERLKQICPPDGKIIVLGQGIGWPQIHYSGRQGWVDQCASLPANWRETFETYHRLGAEFVAVYFDPTVPPKARASYAPLLTALPVVEHRSGPWFTRGRPCEYYILSLDGFPAGGAGADVAGVPKSKY